MTNPIFILYCESPFKTIGFDEKIILDQNDYMIFFGSNVKKRENIALSTVI